MCPALAAETTGCSGRAQSASRIRMKKVMGGVQQSIAQQESGEHLAGLDSILG